MLKMKITNKTIKNSYREVYAAGYCELWYLLKCIEPRYYTSGVYGWNADIYEYDYNSIISTGYRSTGKRIDVNLCREYNKKAREIWDNFNLKYEEQKEQCQKLLDDFMHIVRGI